MSTEARRAPSRPGVSAAVYALASLAGLGVMLFPLWRSYVVPYGAPAPGAGAPVVLVLLVTFCVVALALEASSGGLGARTVAALGVLVAINSLLRLVEVAVPGPAGFTPVFFLIVLAGYVFGARFGFLMGALTMAVSAVVTGGLGPWLPYQMLAAGWVGLTAGWLPGGGRERMRPTRREVTMLAVFGAMWGFGYGLLMTPWTWGYFDMGALSQASAGQASAGQAAAGQAAAVQAVSGAVAEHAGSGDATLRRFLSFYAASSMVWDAFAAGGTALLMIVAGAPVLGALRRMGRWFDFQHDDQGVAEISTGNVAPDNVTLDDVAADNVAPDNVALDDVAAGIVPPDNVTLDSATPNSVATTGSRNRTRALVHPYAWVAWAIGVVALISATRNPVLLLAAVFAVAVVSKALPPTGRDYVGLSIGRMALFVIPVAALYNVLSAHFGNTVLVRLPSRLPLVGGPLTLEALVYGVAVGLSLVALIAAFTTIARAIPIRALTQLVPRAFGSLSLTASISLAYLPAARKQLHEVREAQAVRGHRTRGVRSWLPLVLPLLVGGLERSVTLAESLTARGLAPASRPAPPVLRLAVPVGVAIVLAGWLGAVTGFLPPLPVAAMVTLGLVLAGGALVGLGRRTKRTAFRRDPIRATDVLVAVAAWAPLAVAWFTVAGRTALDYSPLPQVSLPEIDPLLALALLGLVVPATVVGRRRDIIATAQLGAEGRDNTATAQLGAEGRDSTVAVLPKTRRRTSVPATVRFRGFGYTYPGADEPALAEVSFDATPGNLTLVVGSSGSGKSTLLRAVNGLVPHFTGGEVLGSVRVAGRDPVAAGPGSMGEVVGFVSGDPERTFVMDTVSDEVAFALENRGSSRGDMVRRIDWALQQVSLTGFGDRVIDTLSGGERQRVAVAAALAMAPRVLVLDEPTSQVDDDTAQSMAAAIRSLTQQEAVTVLVSEHRLDRLQPYASDTVCLRGQEPPIIVGADAEAGVLAQVLGPPIPEPPALESNRVALQCVGLTFSYGDRCVLNDLALTVHAGEVVALMGASGSGKTTLLRLAVGLLEPSSGVVRVAGQSIVGRDVADICREVGYLPQDPNALLFADTVLDELRVTLANHNRHDVSDSRALALLADLGIAELAERYPRDLSTGQRQRSALAAVAVTCPSVLLLDEPTRGLDGRAISDLARTLYSLAKAGAGVLIATHDRRLASAAHRVLQLESGRVEAPSARESGP